LVSLKVHLFRAGQAGYFPPQTGGQKMSEPISQSSRELVVLVTRGTDHELSSVAFTIACGAITSGIKVYAFLVSAGVDLVRRKAVDVTQVPPLDPLKSLIQDFLARGGTIWACPPCVKARGYAQEDFIDGVTIQGASAMHDRLKAGAASLSF
jgi:predicted peroxiredoxin